MAQNKSFNPVFIQTLMTDYWKFITYISMTEDVQKKSYSQNIAYQ